MVELELYKFDRPERLPEDLLRAIAIYKDLKDRCAFEMLGFRSIKSGGWDKSKNEYQPDQYLSADELILYHPEQLSNTQRRAMIEGMPKVYAAFEAVGFPDLSKFAHGEFTTTRFSPIRFSEFNEASLGRNFGRRCSLFDSQDTISQVLEEVMSGARFISHLDADVRIFFSGVHDNLEVLRQLRAQADAAAANERVASLRRDMRRSVIKGGRTE